MFLVASSSWDYAGEKNVRDCRGFCKRWQQKWFLSVGCSWDSAGEIMNWLGFVVDSVTGGSKNCFSLPVSVTGGSKNCSSLRVFRGTMLAKKNVRACRGFCKRWQQKWFLSVGCPWDYAGEIMNWLGFVVDSVTGGSKNCFPFCQFFVGLCGGRL